jgi:ribonuclease HI
MSVKSFLDKYFKVGSNESESRTPEPSVANFRTRDLETYKFNMRVPVPTPEPNSEVKTELKTFHIFTDGACSDNGKKNARGGFSVYVYSKKESRLHLSQPLMRNEPQTNNRAELRGIQAALDILQKYEAEWSKEYNDYCIWSDSEYSIHCLTKWAAGWRRNGWKKSDGGLIQNIDLIKPIYEKLCSMPRVRLRHVRAHQKGRENEFPFDGNAEADRLARESLSRGNLINL